jgi:hypothetical protein
MKIIASAVIVVAVLTSPAPCWLAPAKAHDWYPKECCNQIDCAPIETMSWFAATAEGVGQVIVTSRHGKAIMRQDFPVRESKDGRMHVCMRRHDSGDMDVVCLFMPPTM